MTFTVKDQNGGSGSATVVITSVDVPPVLTGPDRAAECVRGRQRVVQPRNARRHGSRPVHRHGPWGDGQTSTFYPSGSGPLSFAHAYATAGTYTVMRDRFRIRRRLHERTFSIGVTQTTPTSVLVSSSLSATYGQLVTFTDTVTGVAPGDRFGDLLRRGDQHRR